MSQNRRWEEKINLGANHYLVTPHRPYTYWNIFIYIAYANVVFTVIIIDAHYFVNYGFLVMGFFSYLAFGDNWNDKMIINLLFVW